MSTLFGTLFSAPGGEGSATVNGNTINQTESVAGTPVIIDLQGISRPVSVVITVGSGDTLLYATTTDADALADADDPAWTIQQASITSGRVEIVTSASVKGILVQRVSGSSSDSSVWVWAIFRGPGVPPYNPVYDPSYDVAFADLSDAQRFMRQAGFGEFPGEAQAIITSGDTAGEVFDAWYDGAFVYLPGAWPVRAKHAAAGDNQTRGSLAASWFHRSLVRRTGPTTFRSRIVAAFAKLVPVGPLLSETSSRAWESVQNNMYDLLDGDLQGYVRWLAYNRYVAWFLDNASNNGRNAATGFTDNEPNQNFVREKLQLFTLGQWELNKDGTFKLDGGGNLIPTYEYEDVLNMARLYSGLVNDGSEQELIANAGQHYRGAVNMPTPGITRGAYAEHPAAAPPVGTKFVEGTNIYGKIEEVCQWIIHHPTFPVYFAKLFIHELVTENPTPQYVRRVVAALEDDGAGNYGSLRAMFRAILLDPEARGSASSKNANTFGRALDVHLPVAAAWRNAEQVDLAEHGFVFTGTCTNGSAAITVAAADALLLRMSGLNWNISGTGVPGGATVQWTNATTITMSTNFTGTTGAVTLTVSRTPSTNYFDAMLSTTSVDAGVANNGAGRSPQEWGFAPSVFADYPFDKEGAPGFLARATSLWTPNGVLSMWQSMIRFSDNHSDEVATYSGHPPGRFGIWDAVYMTAGSATNADLIDRAVATQLAGRTLPSAARAKLIEALDQAMVDNATVYGVTDSLLKRERRAALAIGMVCMMPQAMEQV